MDQLKLNHGELRTALQQAVADFAQVLPGQAPLKDFVHHNTLHGYQHMAFTEALAKAYEQTGAYGYCPPETYRAHYRNGRITHADLHRVLAADSSLDCERKVLPPAIKKLTRGEVFESVLVHGLEPLTPAQLDWELRENNALSRFQPGVDKAAQAALMADSQHLNRTLTDLWQACNEVFLAQTLTASDLEQPIDHSDVKAKARASLLDSLAEMGVSVTLRSFLQGLTGIDILHEQLPYLIRHVGSWLDQGMAAWHHHDREEGLFTAWRNSAANNPIWLFEDLDRWQYVHESLPDDSTDAIIVELQRLGLPRDRWLRYLELIALETPGWSGMFLWRDQNPGYQGFSHRIEMMDFLAMRLAMERVFAQRLCAGLWDVEPSLDMLRWVFSQNLDEFYARSALYEAGVPESVVSIIEQAKTTSESGAEAKLIWQLGAIAVYRWRNLSAGQAEFIATQHAWPLFLLAQYRGLSTHIIQQLDHQIANDLLVCMNELDSQRSGFIWLQAFENHYRDQVLQALSDNCNRGRWQQRDGQIEAQIIACMDEREEGLRRLIEAINPDIETLGAAAHFNVPHRSLPLAAKEPIALTPVVYAPVHRVVESVVPAYEDARVRYVAAVQQRAERQSWALLETQRNGIASALSLLISAPVALVGLVGRSLFPAMTANWKTNRIKAKKKLPTKLAFNCIVPMAEPTPQHNQHGFTVVEQADRVQGLLRNLGLTNDFAPLVVVLGHGSYNLNNPHRSAYNCGACSGQHSGANARLLAAMANNAPTRAALQERGIIIPDGCWFIGAEHDTGADRLEWFDLDELPDALQPNLEALRLTLNQACAEHAQERCRKFVSAKPDISPQKAWQHVFARANDFSQARPELGHATNAAAVIGRRSVTQSAFFDRRLFLISYDPSQDEEGSVLEGLLLANGPVGAGINLEYYFSSVNNAYFGSGSKITHNVNGLFGVMEGASSDLRTGLPRQMIEIHEAMRLLVIVEAETEVLTEIYQRQPPIQELVGNGWLLLAAISPSAGSIHLFDPDKGWQDWHSDLPPTQMVTDSKECWAGKMDFVPPALLDEASPS